MTLLPSDVLLELQVAVDNLRDDCHGTWGRVTDWLAEQATGNEYNAQCQNLLASMENGLELLERLAPDADMGSPEEMAAFKAHVADMLDTLENYVDQPSVLRRFVDEVVVQSAKDTAEVAQTVATVAAKSLPGLSVAVGVGALLYLMAKFR